MLCRILLDEIVLNGRLPVVQLLDLLRHDIHSAHIVVLREQNCEGESDI